MEGISQQVTEYLITKLGLAGLQPPRIDTELKNTDLAYPIHSLVNRGPPAQVMERVQEIGQSAQELLARDVFIF